MKAELQFDGGCNPNPGGTAISAFVLIFEDGRRLCDNWIESRNGTNNIAEWGALCGGLKAALAEGIDYLEIAGDSQLVVRQVLGLYRVKKESHKPYYKLAKSILSQLGFWNIKWMPRAQNAYADSLTNRRSLSAQDTYPSPVQKSGYPKSERMRKSNRWQVSKPPASWEYHGRMATVGSAIRVDLGKPTTNHGCLGSKPSNGDSVNPQKWDGRKACDRTTYTELAKSPPLKTASNSQTPQNKPGRNASDSIIGQPSQKPLTGATERKELRTPLAIG